MYKFALASLLASAPLVAGIDRHSSEVETTDCGPPRCSKDNPGIEKTRCYLQRPTKGTEELDSQSNPRRLAKTEPGSVVHYQDSKIPRTEVVASVEGALAGGSNFEVQYQDTKVLTLLDLTRDGMQVTNEGGGDLASSFSIKNAFVVDEPNVLYKVNCPAESVDCLVTATTSEGDALVACREEDSLLFADDIPAACLTRLYDAVVMAVVDGTHFFLHATRRDADAVDRDHCPRNVAFVSEKGMNKKFVIFENDLENLPRHELGAVPLGELIEAEEDVEPLSDEMYDHVTKNCATYARDIMRGVGLPETRELGDFVVRHLEMNPDFLKDMYIALGNKASRALLALKRGSHKDLFEKAVYGQLDIQEDTNE